MKVIYKLSFYTIHICSGEEVRTMSVFPSPSSYKTLPLAPVDYFFMKRNSLGLPPNIPLGQCDIILKHIS